MDAWHEYYTLAGTASATLVGLLFVAASVGSSVWERPAALPVVGYVLMPGSGIAVAMAFEPGAMVLAISIGLLLVVGIRNAWDITVWIVTRRQS